MTASHEPAVEGWDDGWLRLPAPPVSLAQFDALPEDDRYHYEVRDGVLFVSPKPTKRHQSALTDLALQVGPQLDAEHRVIVETEVLLHEAPLSVRAPDLIVVHRSTDMSTVRTPADEVLLAVEIVSPSSRRIDRKDKVAEYADAGIPHYWIVELDAPASITTFHLAGEFGYQESPARTGRVEFTEPFPVTVDLTRLPIH